MKAKKEALPLVNEKIRCERVQLIDAEGTNIGIVPTYKALRMALDAGLDLVMIAEQGKDGVPVTKIMDFGKEIYEKKKKFTEAKKNQTVIQVKEVKMGPSIGEHDYQTKMRQAYQFLKEGKRVKITLEFKGRENITREERGMELFDKITKTFDELGVLKNVILEGESRMSSPKGQIYWSRMFYFKQ